MIYIKTKDGARPATEFERQHSAYLIEVTVMTRYFDPRSPVFQKRVYIHGVPGRGWEWPDEVTNVSSTD